MTEAKDLEAKIREIVYKHLVQTWEHRVDPDWQLKWETNDLEPATDCSIDVSQVGTFTKEILELIEESRPKYGTIGLWSPLTPNVVYPLGVRPRGKEVPHPVESVLVYLLEEKDNGY